MTPRTNRFMMDFYDVISMIFHYHYQWNKADEKERNTVAIHEHLAYIAALRSRDARAIEANAGPICAPPARRCCAPSTPVPCVLARACRWIRIALPSPFRWGRPIPRPSGRPLQRGGAEARGHSKEKREGLIRPSRCLSLPICDPHCAVFGRVRRGRNLLVPASLWCVRPIST